MFSGTSTILFKIPSTLYAAYDGACVLYSTVKVSMMNKFTRVKTNMNNGMVTPNSNLLYLIQSDEFTGYWMAIKEYCKVNDPLTGQTPVERILADFFSFQWKDNKIQLAIDAIQPKKPSDTVAVAIAPFFESLAQIANGRLTPHCQCSDLETILKSGLAPNGQTYLNLKVDGQTLSRTMQQMTDACPAAVQTKCTRIQSAANRGDSFPQRNLYWGKGAKEEDKKRKHSYGGNKNGGWGNGKGKGGKGGKGNSQSISGYKSGEGTNGRNWGHHGKGVLSMDEAMQEEFDEAMEM
jgi:hypothetical protein